MGKKVVVIGNCSSGMYDFRHELISELVNRGCEITALTPFDIKMDDLRALGIDVVETTMNRRGINPIDDFKLMCLYFKLLKKMQPDLVITYTIKPNVYGGFVSGLLRIPYAVNITGLGTAFHGTGILRKIVTLMYKLGSRKAKVVFFENSENRQIFLDEKIVKESQTCLLNGAGVNLSHYHVTDYPAEDKVRFLYIGRVMKEKGVDELFSAMKRMVEQGIQCSLDVLGRYEDDYDEHMQRYAEEGWLNFHGYQPDVRSFIARSHCFVLPSWHEGMANTNLECAASGRPVITSNIHGCLEAVEDGVTGFLCEKQNTEDLYRVMKRFTEMSFEERKAMGLSGRKRMEAIFDKNQVVNMTIEHLLK